MAKSSITNISHDTFMKSILSDRGAAISFLNGFLPEAITSHLNLTAFTYANKSYISDTLKERFADMVFDIPLKETDDQVQVSVLLELKSHKDRYVGFQIMEYLAAGYRHQLKSFKRNQKRLKLIIPVIYYHGKEKWKTNKNASLFIHLPKDFHSLVPEYDQVFIDLKKMGSEELERLDNSLLLTAIRI
ncbi:MAG: Rpn family recombination-promoting nuclease/putative transposase [Saprospiraceae bacterium]|nr:Rpn family recombination-promoting nuclease/putative transposase [Saprospiraceae bacterium]